MGDVLRFPSPSDKPDPFLDTLFALAGHTKGEETDEDDPRYDYPEDEVALRAMRDRARHPQGIDPVIERQRRKEHIQEMLQERQEHTQAAQAQALATVYELRPRG